MTKKSTMSQDRSQDGIEVAMRRVSLVVSLIALGLMAVGFLDLIAHGESVSIPGESVLSLSALLRLHGAPLNLVVMSAGIVLLGFLPAVRVLLALGLYARQRNTMNVIIAVVVLLELFLSLRAGGKSTGIRRRTQ